MPLISQDSTLAEILRFLFEEGPQTNFSISSEFLIPINVTDKLLFEMQRANLISTTR
jgi:hypothetical protein